MLIWLGAFDPRPLREPLRALRFGGLPWWARHIYAIVSRLSMLPPALALWLAPPSAYHDALRGWSFTQAKDQELAASIMIGFEMLLLALAVVLAFIFLSVVEGRERSRAA